MCFTEFPISGVLFMLSTLELLLCSCKDYAMSLFEEVGRWMVFCAYFFVPYLVYNVLTAPRPEKPKTQWVGDFCVPHLPQYKLKMAMYKKEKRVGFQTAGKHVPTV